AASRAAGYRAKNGNVVAASASALLKIPKVAAAVESGRKEVTDEVVRQAAVRNLVTVAEVVLGLKTEAHYRGKGSSHGARVTAWSRLADLLGLNRQHDPEPDAVRVNVINIHLDHPAAEGSPCPTRHRPSMKPRPACRRSPAEAGLRPLDGLLPRL